MQTAIVLFIGFQNFKFPNNKYQKMLLKISSSSQPMVESGIKKNLRHEAIET